VLRGVFDDFLVDIGFDLHVLRCRLDDDIAVCHRLLDVDERRDIVLCGLCVLSTDAFVFGEFVERPRDLLVAVLDELLVDIPHLHRVAR